MKYLNLLYAEFNFHPSFSNMILTNYDVGLTLPNDKILDWSKLKAFADNKINVNAKMKFGMEKVENIVGKGENAVYQHFLLFFPQMFSKGFLLKVIKSRDCVVKSQVLYQRSRSLNYPIP